MECHNKDFNIIHNETINKIKDILPEFNNICNIMSNEFNNIYSMISLLQCPNF